MVDDRSKRRAQTHGDHNRPKSSPLGFPIYVDPELTPPPQEPPSADEVDGSDTISPPVRAVLDQHTEKFAELKGWLEKLAPLRDEKRLDRIENSLGSIAAATNRHQSMLDDMLVPQLQSWRALTDELHGQVPRLIASIEQMALVVGNIEQRIRAVEITVSKMVDRIDGDSRNYEKWFAAAEKDREHMRSRLAVLEQESRDRIVTQQAIAKLERKKSTKAAGAVGGLATVIVTVIYKLIAHFT